MKSKRLIVILCVLAFLTVLIVINSTLFTLQSVSVNWLTTKYELQSVKDYEIADEISKGQSIFLIKKDELSTKLEKDFPYLRVVSIETKFPNKLVIHSAERESLYAVKLSDTEYAILDERGKVLSLSNDSIFAGSEGDLGTKPIRVTFESLSLNLKDFVVGENVGSNYIKNLLTTLSYSLRETSYTPTTSKGVFKCIDVISQGSTSEINMQTRNGMVLKIKNFENFTTDKLLLAFARYNTLHNDGVVSCTIEVFETELGQIYAREIW
ncbi:MAG: cell division protein FtsQ/DivIB [Christensenellales bacterium]